jgi:hypothetical protein
MSKIQIVQIAVRVDDGDEICAVSLPPAIMEMLVPLIHSLSDGPIKLVRLPGVKMVPIADFKDTQND